MKTVSFREYIVEVLKNAIYEKGESSDVIIAEAPDLPGCFTQGKNFEEARQNLIDAIELWVTVGLKKGEEMPVVNGHLSATDVKTHKLFGSVEKERPGVMAPFDYMGLQGLFG